MKKVFCPHCGTINRPYAKFCRKCGFNLAKYKQHQRILNSDNLYLKEPKPQSQQIQRPIPPRSNPYKHHHSFGKFIGIIVLAIIVLCSGAYVYNHHKEEVANNNERSQASQPIQQPSQDNSNSEYNDDNSENDEDENNQSTYHDSSDYKMIIKTFWSNINNKLGTEHNQSYDYDGEPGGNDISDFFKNDTSNSSYKGIKDWAKLIVSADSNNDTQPIAIKPYDIKSDGDGNIHYKVYYDFKLKSGIRHIQIFNWDAVIKSNKIISMNSLHKPSEDYKE